MWLLVIKSAKVGALFSFNHSKYVKILVNDPFNNRDTLETKIYPSIIKAAEDLACSEGTIRYYLKHNKPYKGKYLLKKIDKV